LVEVRLKKLFFSGGGGWGNHVRYLTGKRSHRKGLRERIGRSYRKIDAVVADF
jgi:hypothetical protein